MAPKMMIPQTLPKLSLPHASMGMIVMKQARLLESFNFQFGCEYTIN